MLTDGMILTSSMNIQGKLIILVIKTDIVLLSQCLKNNVSDSFNIDLKFISKKAKLSFFKGRA